MTPEQVDLVERTLALVEPRMPEVGTAFYRRLLTADAGLRSMFSADPVVQQEKFARELAEIVATIRTHGAFLDRASALGLRHEGYGVLAQHYRAGGQALLEALAAVLREAWTEEVESAWRMAYALTVEVMQGAR